MSCTKSTMESYQIHKDHEYANISLRCWDNPAPAGSSRGMYYGGEIMIHSSFGSWANSWNACGSPFKRFLLHAGFDYLFTKFMGVNLERFDGEATLRQIRADIIEQRRGGSLSKDEARDVMNAVEEQSERLSSSDATAYGYAMWDVAGQLDRDHPMHEYFSDPCGWPRLTHDDYGAAGFWREIWPEFKAALEAELQPEAVPA
jgi:hypothetical protein